MTRVPSLGRRGEGWLLLQIILLWGVVAAGVYGFLNPAWDGGLRLAAAAVGVILLALGARQIWRGSRDLGSNMTPLPRPVDDATLIESGIYARVRHPIYGGIIVAALGWGLLAASPIGILLAAVLVPLFWLKSSVEERWLAERFPSYPDYRRRTRRFIAWIG
jgi:protein-S-isoprenylcysteine O-methyltransferase Ste14